MVALEQAGLSDEEMLDRLRATNQVFDLTPEQQRYLLEKGVSQGVIDQLPTLNMEKKDELLEPSDNVITRDRNSI